MLRNATIGSNHLFMQATGQPKEQIFAETDRESFLKVVDAQVTFVSDHEGHVIELILHPGGHDHHAKRVEEPVPDPVEHK